MGDTSPIHIPRGSRYPNSRVLRPYPYSEWFLDSETLLFGYLDPLGNSNS